MTEDDDAVDETSEAEEPKKSSSSAPQPPYGGNIPAKWRNTPFDDLPPNLQAAVKGG